MNEATALTLAVARFTRAWIETATPGSSPTAFAVARFTRAWIETSQWPAL